MNDALLYSLVMLAAYFMSSCSQILLKTAADKKYENGLAEYLNVRVLVAYAIFGICTVVAMFSLRYIPLSLAPVLEASGYIYIAVLSRYLLEERISKRKLAGIVLIITGTLLFVLW